MMSASILTKPLFFDRRFFFWGVPLFWQAPPFHKSLFFDERLNYLRKKKALVNNTCVPVK